MRSFPLLLAGGVGAGPAWRWNPRPPPPIPPTMAAPFAWIRPEPHGIHVVPADCWIDPSQPVANALVTHGHADHARGGHGRTVATAETLAIMEVRYQTREGARPAAYGETIALPGGVNATFVGHPLFDELPADRTSARGLANPAAPTVGIIPGSRRSEVKANLPHLIEVMHAIAHEFPQSKFLVPTTAASNTR